MDIEKAKIKKQLIETEKICYAMDQVKIPSGYIDCSEGCNPFGFPSNCKEVMKNFDASRMAPYPHSEVLYDAIHEFWKEQSDVKRNNILLTDGSISALYIINSIFDTHNTVMLGIAPQFTDHYMHTIMSGIEYKTYQLKKDNNYKFELNEFMATNYINDISTCNFIYIDNPNNPTGQSIDIKKIEKIVEKAFRCNEIVIIDEAYGDFMDKSNSAISIFSKYSNLIVVRTLSKGFGLAGMRIGYIIAHSDLIECMNKMVNPYMVSEISREVAAEAMKHEEFIEASKKNFVYMKNEIRNALAAGGRLHMAETLDTNSIMLVYHDKLDINLREEFYKLGVLVIDGNDFKGLDSSSARVRLPIIKEFPALLNAINVINRKE